MSSSDESIQKKYDIINKYIKTLIGDNEKVHLLSKPNLSYYIEETLGITHNYEAFLYRKDFLSRLSDRSDKDVIYKNNSLYKDGLYHIVFINDGIRISMSKNFLNKIPIFKSIIIDEKGSDKGLNIPIYNDLVSTFQNKFYLYITNLELESIHIVDIKEEDYNDMKLSKNLKQAVIKASLYS